MQPVELASGLWRWSAPHPDWKPNAVAGSSADWPEEVAESIVWLLSDKASLVTGAILNVMGAQR